MIRSLASERRGEGFLACAALALRGERSRDRTLSALGPCSGLELEAVLLPGAGEAARRGLGPREPSERRGVAGRERGREAGREDVREPEKGSRKVPSSGMA